MMGFYVTPVKSTLKNSPKNPDPSKVASFWGPPNTPAFQVQTPPLKVPTWIRWSNTRFLEALNGIAWLLKPNGRLVTSLWHAGVFLERKPVFQRVLLGGFAMYPTWYEDARWVFSRCFLYFNLRGNDSNWVNIFRMGWNHQTEILWRHFEGISSWDLIPFGFRPCKNMQIKSTAFTWDGKEEHNWWSSKPDTQFPFVSQVSHLPKRFYHELCSNLWFDV